VYTPETFESPNHALTLELIRRYEFAMLLTADNDECFATHIPFILEDEGRKEARILAHMARKNPQWKTLDPARKLTIVFQGPHSYISPRWYQADDGENVPTWNYAAVHVHGYPHVIEDEGTSFGFIQKLIQRHEDNWRVELPSAKIRAMLKEVVAFEIRDLSFEAKFKMSQNRPEVDQRSVIKNLSLSPSPMERDTANLMRKVLGITD
jgi:transcriptional regulator